MINLDQLYTRDPITTLAGTEILLASKAGITGGMLLSAIKTFVKAAFVANDISNASTIGKGVLTAADLEAVQTLLEITPAVAPLAPVSIGVNTTLDDTHVNRKVIASAGGITLTTDAGETENTDYIYIINPQATAIDIDAGAGEEFIVVGSSTPVATYELASASSLRATLLDANTWFIEPCTV